MAEENGKSNGNEVGQTTKAVANTAKGAAKAGKAIGGALKGVAGGPAGMVAGAVSSGGIKYGIIGCVLMVVVPIVIGICILACLGSLLCGLLFGTSFDDVEPDVEDPKGEYDEYVEKLSKVFEESYAETIRGASIAIADHAVDTSNQEFINNSGNPTLAAYGDINDAETWLAIHNNLLSYDGYPQKYDSEKAYWYDNGWYTVNFIDENATGAYEEKDDGSIEYEVEWTNDMAFVIAAYSLTQPYDSEDTARKNNDSSVQSTKMMKKLKKVDYFPADYEDPALTETTYSWYHWVAGTKESAKNKGADIDNDGTRDGYISYYEEEDNGLKKLVALTTETGGYIFYPQVEEVTINTHEATITIGEFDRMAVLTAFDIDPYARYIYPNQDAVVDWEEVLTEDGKRHKELIDDYNNGVSSTKPDNLSWKDDYYFTDDDIIALLIQYYDIEKFVDMPDYAGSESKLKEVLEDEAEKRGLEINYTGNISFDYESLFQNIQLNNNGLEKIYNVQDKYPELANAVKIASTDEEGNTIYAKNIWPSSWTRNKSLINDLGLAWSDFDFSDYDIYYLYQYWSMSSWSIIENALNQYCPWADEIKGGNGASNYGSKGLESYVKTAYKAFDSSRMEEVGETIKVATTTALADEDSTIGDIHADSQYYAMTNIEKIEQDAESIANTIAADEEKNADEDADDEDEDESEDDSDANRTKYKVVLSFNGEDPTITSSSDIEGESKYSSVSSSGSIWHFEDEIDEVRNTLASDARALIGTPYCSGGEGYYMCSNYYPNYVGSYPVFDCSGFTAYLYRTVCNISLPTNVAASSNNSGQWFEGLSVSKGDSYSDFISRLEVGDLIFMNPNSEQGGLPGHVGIYVGNGNMVDAHSEGYNNGNLYGEVIEESILNRVGNDTWSDCKIMGARRIIDY